MNSRSPLGQGRKKGLLPLYEGYAVPPDYAGPFADEFHRMVARNYLKGMIGGHTSAVRGATAADLAREHLAFDWCRERGLYRGMNRFDSKFNWRKWKHWEDEISKVRCWVAKVRYRNTPNPYNLSTSSEAKPNGSPP